MKNFILVTIMLTTLIPYTYAMSASYDSEYITKGFFKKQRNGNFVQYDKNGKKIGTYKILNGKLVQIK